MSSKGKVEVTIELPMSAVKKLHAQLGKAIEKHKAEKKSSKKGSKPKRDGGQEVMK